jgi:hypothetical protein
MNCVRSKTIICNSLVSDGLKMKAIKVPVCVAPVGIEGIPRSERAGQSERHALKGDVDVGELLVGYLGEVDVEQFDKTSFV